jgi:hypothetical protein
MNQKAVDYLYEYAKGQGYQNPKENFISLIQTNDEAFNKLYESAKNSGYSNDINAFGLLLGRKPVEPIRRSEEGAAPTPTSMDGGGAEEQPMPAAPESTSVAVKDVTPQAQSAMVVRKPVEPDKEGVSPTPPIMESRGGTGAETPKATPSALESDISSQLLPVTENTQIKEVPVVSDKMVIKSPEKRTNFLEAADEILYQIYNSPGYLQKLENEIAQSKESYKDTDPKLLDELKVKRHELIKKTNNFDLDMSSKEYKTLTDELNQVDKSIREMTDDYIGGKSNAADLINERKKTRIFNRTLNQSI